MFDKEIVVELDYESVRGGRYLNVINVYSLEEAEEFITVPKARDEIKRGNGMLGMNFIEMVKERRAEIASNFNNTQEVEVNENEVHLVMNMRNLSEFNIYKVA